MASLWLYLFYTLWTTAPFFFDLPGPPFLRLEEFLTKLGRQHSAACVHPHRPIGSFAISPNVQPRLHSALTLSIVGLRLFIMCLSLAGRSRRTAPIR